MHKAKILTQSAQRMTKLSSKALPGSKTGAKLLRDLEDVSLSHKVLLYLYQFSTADEIETVLNTQRTTDDGPTSSKGGYPTTIKAILLLRSVGCRAFQTNWDR